MSITDILIRSISGYVFMVPSMIYYFFRLQKLGKKQAPLHIAAVFVFCYYLIGILTMTGIGKLKPFSPRFALIPFLGILTGPVDSILNILLFIPLGLFLPLLYREYDRAFRIALTGFFFSLSIEFLQMFGRGASDINDLISNTAGAYLGYLAYRLFCKMIPRKLYEGLQASKIHGNTQVLLLMLSAFFVMVTMQPFLIHHVYGLG